MRDAALSDIAALQQDLDEAACVLVEGALRGLALTQADSMDRDALRAVLSDILEACSFQDLAGQRLQRIQGALLGLNDARADAHLLNGPMNGQAPSQADIDALFGDQTRTR